MEHGLDTLSRDLRNRVTGVGAGVRYRVTGRKVDDTVLTERVRARLGLVAGHPNAIDVSTASGKQQNDLNFLAVWREENGKWRFLAWQSCRNPPAADAKK